MSASLEDRHWRASEAAKHSVMGDGKRTVWSEAFAAGFKEGQDSMSHRDAEKVGLPPTPFFFTIEQVATMLQISETGLSRMLFYMGRSTGVASKGKLVATNLAPEGQTPEWRVLDRHFIQYLRFKGIRFHTPGYR